MSKKSIQENDPKVKRNPNGSAVGKTRRKIPKGIALTNADIAKVAERHGWSKKRAETEIKREFENLINGHPGMTSATKRLAIKLGWWYMPDKRLARASIPTLARTLEIGHATVSRAIKSACDFGYLFIESGGPSRRGSLGAVANKYAADLRRVINPDTGELVKRHNYHTPARKSISRLKSYPQNEGVNPYPQNEVTSKPANPGGASSRTLKMRESTKVRCGAPLPHAEADAPTRSAPAPSEKEFGIKVAGYERREFYIELKTLAQKLEISIAEFLGGGNSETGLRLDRLCYGSTYTGGKPCNSPLESMCPDDISAFVHVEVIAGKGIYRKKQTPNSVPSDSINGDDIVYIQYRIPPAVQEKAERDFAKAESAHLV